MKITVRFKYEDVGEDRRILSGGMGQFLLKRSRVTRIVCTKKDAERVRKIRKRAIESIKENFPYLASKFSEDVLCRDDLYFGAEIKVSSKAKEGQVTLMDEKK